MLGFDGAVEILICFRDRVGIEEYPLIEDRNHVLANVVADCLAFGFEAVPAEQQGRFDIAFIQFQCLGMVQHNAGDRQHDDQHNREQSRATMPQEGCEFRGSAPGHPRALSAVTAWSSNSATRASLVTALTDRVAPEILSIVRSSSLSWFRLALSN